MKEKVVILYGALRSGTTMFRLMLDAHSKITCPGERDFMVGFFENRNGHLRLNKGRLADARIFLDTELTMPKSDDAQEAFWELVAQHNAGENTLVLVLHRGLHECLQVFPEAKIIHLLRDPRDVARSSIGMGWVGNSFYGVDHWLKTESDWNKYAKDLPSKQVYELQFEQLLSEPVEKLEQVCEFLEVPFEKSMLNFDEGSTYSKVDPSLAYQWKRKQTARELSELEAKIGSLLQGRGYEASGHAVVFPRGFRAIYLRAQNKYRRTMNRINRYGLINTLQLKFAMFFGMTRIVDRIRLERKDIDRAHLK